MYIVYTLSTLYIRYIYSYYATLPTLIAYHTPVHIDESVVKHKKAFRKQPKEHISLSYLQFYKASKQFFGFIFFPAVSPLLKTSSSLSFLSYSTFTVLHYKSRDRVNNLLKPGTIKHGI